LAKDKRSLPALYSLVVLVAILVLAEPLLVSRYYSKATQYLSLKRLESAEVVSIRIGTTLWDQPEEIHAFVEVLHRSSWVFPMGGIGRTGPAEPFVVTLSSGQRMEVCIGRHYFGGGPLRDEGVIMFFLAGSDSCASTDVLALIPNLPSWLESKNHSLPK
jgi:hypothetical protein